MSKPCPSCGSEMKLGALALGQSLLGNLAAPLALPKLFFQASGKPRLPVLDWGSADPPAYRCGSCGTVVFLGKSDGA